MASAPARTLTPAAQHRKTMGDFNRKETARVLSSMRRASHKQLQDTSATASTAAVYPVGSHISRGSGNRHRRVALSTVALIALALSLTALVVSTLLMLSTPAQQEA